MFRFICVYTSIDIFREVGGYFVWKISVKCNGLMVLILVWQLKKTFPNHQVMHVLYSTVQFIIYTCVLVHMCAYTFTVCKS